MTDYEPNVAQYAYAVNRPLICLEQQSKFLYLSEEKIEHYSITEFDMFLSNIKTYIYNMQNYKKKYWRQGWEQEFISILQDKYEIG